MTLVEERLRELMQRAAPTATAVDFDAITSRVRRRRLRATIGSTVAVVAVLAAGTTAAVAAWSGPGSDSEQLTTGPSPTSSPPTSSHSVAFQGVEFTLPDGWTVARPHCGPPANDTVVRGVWTGSCPGGIGDQPPTTGVTLTSIYGRQYALSWPGHRTVWHGQPAWLSQTTSHGTTTVTLSLPWLNAVVTTQSGNSAEARRLLDQVTANPEPGLAVPDQASSIFIQSLAGVDGDGQQRNANITDRHEVETVLSDLRGLSPVTSPAHACNGSWWPSTAVLTVHSSGGTRTYAARFDRCGLVVAGTGSAGVSSQQLLGDIRRLVPNSGL